jgi:hypothetical protein
LTTIESVIATRLPAPPTSAPKSPALAPTADSIVVATTATPATPIRWRLRSRARIGFARRLRGTDHATFIAFCMAWATPSAPYTAMSAPTISAPMLPRSPRGSPSCSPITGNWLNVESRTLSCSSGFPCSTNPRIDASRSSSGNIDRNP